MRVEKTVFISYRRTHIFHARAIFQDLRANGYDVFLDYESLDSGSFEQVIMNQIRARAHFLVILTPSALERCEDPNDWLRREIETALESKRNIVPLMLEGFNWNTVSKYLTGKLAVLNAYNSLEVPATYFDEAMTRLRTRFLNQPLEVILHPTPPAEVPAVIRAIAEEAAQPKVEERELKVSEYFERAFQASERGDHDAAIRDYTEAIRLYPNDVHTYIGRGIEYINKSEHDLALSDFTEALRLNPQYPNVYVYRGYTYININNYDRALSDFTEALQLNPQYALAYEARGNAHLKKGDYHSAIADCDAALQIDHNYAHAFCTRGAAYRALKQYDRALADLNAALQIDPDYQFAKRLRKEILWEIKG
jgi:tetratricopeptide (TPR) repeat protein